MIEGPLQFDPDNRRLKGRGVQISFGNLSIFLAFCLLRLSIIWIYVFIDAELFSYFPCAVSRNQSKLDGHRKARVLAVFKLPEHKQHIVVLLIEQNLRELGLLLSLPDP